MLETSPPSIKFKQDFVGSPFGMECPSKVASNCPKYVPELRIPLESMGEWVIHGGFHTHNTNTSMFRWAT